MSRREREASEVGAMSRRVFRALVRRAGDGDVEALRELVALQAALSEAVTDAGRAMHDAGFSYTYLAAETGVTRQAARKRYGRSGEQPPAGPSLRALADPLAYAPRKP